MTQAGILITSNAHPLRRPPADGYDRRCRLAQCQLRKASSNSAALVVQVLRNAIAASVIIKAALTVITHRVVQCNQAHWLTLDTPFECGPSSIADRIRQCTLSDCLSIRLSVRHVPACYSRRKGIKGPTFTRRLPIVCDTCKPVLQLKDRRSGRTRGYLMLRDKKCAIRSKWIALRASKWWNYHVWRKWSATGNEHYKTESQRCVSVCHLHGVINSRIKWRRKYIFIHRLSLARVTCDTVLRFTLGSILAASSWRLMCKVTIYFKGKSRTPLPSKPKTQ